MEESNTIDSTTELNGEKLIHTILTEVEQLQSEQFNNTTATFDSLLPNYDRCNSVNVDEMLAESGPEIGTFHFGTGFDDTALSDCDIRLQKTKLKPLDSNTSNFDEQSCDEISPTRNDGFGVQENSTEPSAELVAIKPQLQQQQEILLELHQNNSKLEFRKQLNISTESNRLNVKTFLDDGQQLQDPQVEQEPTAEVRSPPSDYGQVEKRRGIETVRSYTEECNQRIFTVTRSKDNVELHHESVGQSAQPMSLFQDDNINQSDESLHVKQVSSVGTGKVDGKPFTLELHNTEASRKNPQSSRAGSKTHSCGECKKQFNFKSNLTAHVRIHTGEKPFKCEFCNSTFSQANNLKSHHRIHSGEKPFKCEFCNSSFSHSHNLKIHHRIHSGEKPFQCEFCNSTFSQANNLKTHHRIHSGEKPFQCEFCNSTFSQANNLKRHQRIHSGRKAHKSKLNSVKKQL